MRKEHLLSCLICALCGGSIASAAVVRKDVGELTVQARQIVVGDVAEVTSFWDGNHALIKSRIVVMVSDYLVGGGDGTEVLEMDGGTVGDDTLRVSVLPIFHEGDHVLLFLGDSEIRLVESFQGAYLTDGVEIARMAPACGRLFEESLQPLAKLLEEIRQALPPGTVLPELTPYEGSFQLPVGGPRYALCGADWTYQANPMGENYKINANCVDGSAGSASSQRTQIQNGSDVWNNAGADFAFTYGGTSSQTSVSYNGTNLVHFDTTPPGGGGYVAATYYWLSGNNITECDLVFNDQYTWWNGSGSCGGNKFDIWNVAAHEFGHFLCLDHSSYTTATMYAYVSECQISARTLHSDDINGIIAIYGTGGSAVCDNGSCEAGENCANCPEDCGPCDQYCSASSTSTAFEYISNVAVGSINNSSGSSGYADYTGQSTDMEIGTGYSITVTLDTTWSSDIGGLWVDWNQDNDFNDAGEAVTTSWSGLGPYTATITPPAGAAEGSTRIRVRIHDGDYDPSVSPCGTTSYGEVEDYSINVTQDSADTDPPTPNPMTFATAPYPYSSSAIRMIATTATDADSPPVQYRFDFVSGGSGGTDSGWQGSTTYTDTGLTPDTSYTYRVKARDNASPPNETTYSSSATTATLANVPAAPTLSNRTLTTLRLNVNPNGNPSTTTFAILCSGTSPSDANWNGKYVNAGGNPSGAAVWRGDSQWGNITIQGLQACTDYTFTVKARNQNLVQTASGPGATEATTGLPGDIDGDGDRDGDDVAGFVRAKLSLPPAPGDHPACADYGTGSLNGDMALFVADLLN